MFGEMQNMLACWYVVCICDGFGPRRGYSLGIGILCGHAVMCWKDEGIVVLLAVV